MPDRHAAPLRVYPTDQRLDARRERLAARGNGRGLTTPLPGSFQARAQVRPCRCHACGQRFLGCEGEWACASCLRAGHTLFDRASVLGGAGCGGC